MGAILIIIIIFIATIVIMSIKEGDITLGFIEGFLSLIVSFMILIFISIFPNSEEVYSESIEITALKDNSNVNGSFFIGSGAVDEKQYYYYIKNTNRGKVVEKISTENAYLNEGEYEPHIKVYRDEYTGSIARWLYGNQAWGDAVYEIYIPEGSVTTEFNVDLE